MPRSVAPSPTISGIVPNPEYVPAFASLARATVAPASSSARAGGRRSRRTIAGAGSSGGDRLRAGNGGDALLVELLEMVDRCGAKPDPELGRPGSRELLGVQPQAEARRDRRSADALGRGEVEEAGIREDVDELGQALRGDGRDHLVRDALRVAPPQSFRRGRRGRQGRSPRREPAADRRRAE